MENLRKHLPFCLGNYKQEKCIFESNSDVDCNRFGRRYHGYVNMRCNQNVYFDSLYGSLYDYKGYLVKTMPKFILKNV